MKFHSENPTLAKKTSLLLIAFFLCVLVVYFRWQYKPNSKMPIGQRFSQVAIDGLPNCIRVCQGVYSGGQPEPEVGFESLSNLGIKTIISVDGALPDVESAAKLGLKYVHLPHGYDGINREQAVLLSKAIGDLDGPYYVHCHHGKHRSPAAAAVACIGRGIFNSNQGLQLLSDAGTSTEYRGLYQSVAGAVKFESTELDKLEAKFPERVPGGPLVESMVEIEKHFKAINLIAENQWDRSPTHPDLDAAHEALLMFEQFAELVRSETEAQREYRKILNHSKNQALRLHELLSKSKATGSFDDSMAKRLIHDIKSDCRICHRKFRD